MNIVPQDIFYEFKDKVSDPSYFPLHPLDTLKAHLTAAWLLQAHDANIIKRTKAFILKTAPFNNQTLSHLEQLAAQVKSWDNLRICSSYVNHMGKFLEYQLLFTTIDQREHMMHFHARYETQEKRCYFVSQNVPLIRVAGDPILQRPGVLFPEYASAEQQQELARQIEHAKSVLIQTGGAGIAANQCYGIAKPYRFTIVGIFHDISEHTIGVEKRYPNTKFPQAMIMVNPEIKARSKETQIFNHACLSVPCANRCTVVSPMTISVTYQDPLNAMRPEVVTLNGINAVVLWHELTHIVNGKTYMDVTFEALSSEDLIQFKKMAHHEIQRRQTKYYAEVPELTVPPFYVSVKINSTGVPELDTRELAKVLPKITTETLSGLLRQASMY